MRLYLTLEEGELKIEKVIEVTHNFDNRNFNDIVGDMVDSIDTLMQEEIKTEANRLVEQDKSQS